jgi:predicted  nucleic acid-binding Zn-ribbon protein
VNEEKIESMLSQLIKMVGNIHTEQKEMKQDQKNMQQKLQELEKKAEERHKEILERFTAIETDQDFIWAKTARNEREIAHIKGRLS